MNRSLVRLGFILFLLALLTGLAVPAFARPQLGVSAHLIAAMGGLVLIGVGAIWGALNLGAAAKRLLYWLWVAALFGNWLQTLTASIVGGTRLMPIASGGVSTPSVAETILSGVIIFASLIALVATILTIWGLRGAAAVATGAE